MLKVINIILAVFSRLLVMAGILLGYLANKRMDVMRNMTYRNGRMMETVLAPMMRYCYMFALIGVAVWITYLLLERKRNLNELLSLYIVITATFVALAIVPSMNMIAVPLVTLGLLTAIVDSVLAILRKLKKP